MDATKNYVLQKMNELGEGYVFIDLNDLTDAPCPHEELSQTFHALALDKYLDIKYERGELLCVKMLKPYPEEEAILPQITEVNYAVCEKRHYIFCAAFSLLGGFLGSLITNLIFLAVR